MAAKPPPSRPDPVQTSLELKITPKSSRDAILGWLGDAVKVSVTAVPEKGKANEAVVELLATALDLPPSRIEMLAGHSSPRKRVLIHGLDHATVQARLTQALTKR